MVKGEYDEQSDIDMCIIGINIPEIDTKGYEKILKRGLHLTKFSISQFDKLKEKDFAYYIELLKGVSFEGNL